MFDQELSSYPTWKKNPCFWKFMFQAHLQTKLSIVYPALSLGICCCSSPWASWLSRICTIISYSFCTVKHSSWKGKTQINFVYIYTNTSWWFAIRVKSQLISSFPDAVIRGLLHQYLCKQSLQTLIVDYFLKVDSEIFHLKGNLKKRNIQLVYAFFWSFTWQAMKFEKSRCPSSSPVQ